MFLIEIVMNFKNEISRSGNHIIKLVATHCRLKKLMFLIFRVLQMIMAHNADPRLTVINSIMNEFVCDNSSSRLTISSLTRLRHIQMN